MCFPLLINHCCGIYISKASVSTTTNNGEGKEKYEMAESDWDDFFEKYKYIIMIS